MSLLDQNLIHVIFKLDNNMLKMSNKIGRGNELDLIVKKIRNSKASKSFLYLN